MKKHLALLLMILSVIAILVACTAGEPPFVGVRTDHKNVMRVLGNATLLKGTYHEDAEAGGALKLSTTGKGSDPIISFSISRTTAP